MKTIGFIGLGLIGGSIAKAIRKYHEDYRLLAYDQDRETLAAAVSSNMIDAVCEEHDERFRSCDYIFLCAPVEFNVKYLEYFKDNIGPDTILTDVGSVKGIIHKEVERLGMESRFIGGHPMAGSEKTGFEASSDRLIENAYYFITPSPDAPTDRVEEFMTFIGDLGAIPIRYSPDEHDKITSYISHVPHVIAASLVNLVRHADSPDGIFKSLAAGGFKDITRIASSNPVVWEHILLSNPKNIVNGLKEYIELLNKMIYDIERNDAKDINAFFESSREYRDSIPNNTSGVIRMQYELFVDIPDEPGALAKVTVLLADAGINLKNFGISHNREDEEGVLRLSFYDTDACRKAFDLLADAGYRLYNR